MNRTIVVVCMIVVLTVAGTLYLRHKGYLPGANAVQRTPEIVLQLENVRIVGRNKGRKAWSIEAKRVDVSQSRIQSTLHDIHDGIIYQDNKPAAKVSAGTVVYNESDRSLDAGGGLKVVAADGVQIASRDARYDSWKNLLICPGRVTVKSKRSTAEAASLVANLKTNEVEAKGLKMKAEVSEVEKLLEKQESGGRGKH